MIGRLLPALLLFVACLSTGIAETLRVGVQEKPPYAMLQENGSWAGLGVELWEASAARLGVTTHYVPLQGEDLLTALRNHTVDAVVGEVAVGPSSERVIDFTQPYLLSSLAVAVPAGRWRPDWGGIAADFLNWDLVRILVGILVALFLASVLIWAAERWHATGHFAGPGLEGFGSALWFSAVTMTTVGYGDKTPQTIAGRLIAFAWMLCGVLLIAAFTGSVASSMATARLSGEISNPSDFARFRTGTLADGEAEADLLALGIRTVPFESVTEGLAAIRAGKLDAFAADRIVLAYAIQHGDGQGLRLVSMRISEFPIAIGLPQGSVLRESLNIALLEVIATPEWASRMKFWLGLNAPAPSVLRPGDP